MAHELDFDQNGNARFASIRLHAWHGLGTVIPDYVSAEEMLKVAGLDYEVTLEEVRNASNNEIIPDVRATTRSIDGKTLGIVGKDYHVIQPSTTLEIGNAILGEEAQWETLGALKGGRTIFGLAKLNKEIYVAGEQIMPYFLIENSYTGKQALRLTQTPVRVVCQNTLNFAMRGNDRILKITHSVNYERRLAEGAKTLGLVKKYYESFEQQAEKLVNSLFSKAMFEDLAASLIPIAEDASKATKTHAENARETLINCYSADDLANVTGTAWCAYNAVADYSDHWQKTRGLQGRELRERAFDRAFHDTDLKDKALEMILATV